MKKQLQTLIYMLLISTLAPHIFAEPLITGIFYDPDGVDTGFEWIELYNPTNQTVNLSDYALFKGNGDKENDWTSLPALSGTLYPSSFYLIGESNITTADQVTKLALFNGPDAVALRSLDGEIVDLVGYGTIGFAEYALAKPAADVVSGNALMRRFVFENDTYVFSQVQNNSQDWQSVTNPRPRNSLFQYTPPLIQNISVSLIVPQLPIIIENITLSDNQQSRAGIQWSLAGKKELILEITDPSNSFSQARMEIALNRNGVERLLPLQIVSVDNSTTEHNKLLVSILTSLTSDVAAGNYTLLVRIIQQNETQTTVSRQIDVLPSIGLTVCDSVLFTFVAQNEYRGSCLVRNVGNVPASFGLNLTFDAQIHHTSYYLSNGVSLDTTNSTPLEQITLTLLPGQMEQLTLLVNVSTIVTSGTYLGILQVQTWASN